MGRVAEIPMMPCPMCGRKCKNPDLGCYFCREYYSDEATAAARHPLAIQLTRQSWQPFKYVSASR